ncbi:TIGR02147 family protein [Bdellovibrio sp. HCB337]|uniref:TIGR02147 family protein n=1 Tax=Bdellovibrio sp. HCB337 TaxID=3394358 RepID=UPI0039A60694
MHSEKDNLLVLKLNEEFERRRQKNKRYSLRAFAHYLEVDPSNLSKILRGERVPSLQGAQLFLDKLALEANESSRVLSSITQTKTEAKLNLKTPFRPIQEELARTSQWMHFVLLEILQIVKVNASTMPKIAEGMGVTNEELEKSLRELTSANLIKMSVHSGDYELISKNNTTTNLPYTCDSLKAIQRVFLAMAANAIEKYPLNERENTTLTVAVSTDQLPEIKSLLKKTRQKINRLCEQKSKKRQNAVYNVSMALYPVFTERM